jgi:hypothetical protein
MLSASQSGQLTQVGSSVALSPGNHIGGNQYALTLSVAGTPKPIYQSVDLIATIVDVKGLTFTSGQTPVNRAKGRVFPTNSVGQGTDIVYVTNQGAPNYVISVTANKVGQAAVDVYFPTFDNTEGVDFIYATVWVTVVA